MHIHNGYLHGSEVHGAVVIDGSAGTAAGAHLRWFILSEVLRGQGVGHQLLSQALDFCRAAGHARVHLWTFDGLHAARHLYEKHGFRLVLQQRGTQWGRAVDEQRFDCALGPAGPGCPGGPARISPDPA
jgi:GNAT superfamily N-acetyltransferase